MGHTNGRPSHDSAISLQMMPRLPLVQTVKTWNTVNNLHATGLVPVCIERKRKMGHTTVLVYKRTKPTIVSSIKIISVSCSS